MSVHSSMNTKILVLSDIHNAGNAAAEILNRENDADVIIFLGDGERKFEFAMAKNGLTAYGSEHPLVYQVAGNCDWDSTEASVLFTDIAGIRLCISHGHGYGVKSKAGIISFAEYASDSGCKAALFGHTHKPFSDEIAGVKMFNPGAVLNGRYGVAVISDNRISFEHRMLP